MAPLPGYTMLQGEPLLHEDEELDTTRRRLFFDDRLDDAELARAVAFEPNVHAPNTPGSRWRSRVGAACGALAVIGLLAALPETASQVPGRSHVEGATGLSEQPASSALPPSWIARNLVLPPAEHALEVPGVPWPQTPSPAPLPKIELPPTPELPKIDLPPMPTFPQTPPPAPLAHLPTVGPLPTLKVGVATLPPLDLPTLAPNSQSTTLPEGAGTTAEDLAVTGDESNETVLPATSTPTPAPETTAASTSRTGASTTSASASTTLAVSTTELSTTGRDEPKDLDGNHSALPPKQAELASNSSSDASTSLAATSTGVSSTSMSAKRSPESDGLPSSTSPAAQTARAKTEVASTTRRHVSWSPYLVEEVGNKTTTQTATTTTLVPLDICNRAAPIPSVNETFRRWDAPNTSLDLCFRMFADKDKLANGSKDDYDRNFCWVATKRYGCLHHLQERITWKEAQEKAAKEGGFPASSFQPLLEPQLCDKQQDFEVHDFTKEQLWMASAWFQENVAVYVLNLGSQQERWLNISKRLHRLQILHDRVPGFNMTARQDVLDAVHEGALPESFNISRAQDEALLPKNGMGGISGTIGQAAGHFRAVTRAAKARRRPITLIFEDDAHPDDDFVPQVWNLVRKELPCGWDAVSLGSRCPYGTCISKRLSRVEPDGNEPEWRCRHGVNYGFQGVLYRTDAMEDLVKKWQPVVFNESRPHCLDVDVALAAISDQVAFYAVPSIQALLSEKEGKGGSVTDKINNGTRMP